MKNKTFSLFASLIAALFSLFQVAFGQDSQRSIPVEPPPDDITCGTIENPGPNEGCTMCFRYTTDEFGQTCISYIILCPGQAPETDSSCETFGPTDSPEGCQLVFWETKGEEISPGVFVSCVEIMYYCPNDQTGGVDIRHYEKRCNSVLYLVPEVAEK